MADGDNLLLGRQNTSSSETHIARSGATPNVSSLVVANDNGNCVVGNAVSAWPGVVGTSESGNGVLGTSMISNGVRGISSQGVGVSGRCEDPSGTGVFGEAVVGGVGGGTGVMGSAAGDGTGVAGYVDGAGNAVMGNAAGDGGTGIFGNALGLGGGTGVRGNAAGDGTGVIGYVDGAGNGVWGEAGGAGYGVVGKAPSPGGGIGVFGEALAGGGTGVSGNAPNGGNGVVGSAPSPGWAGVFWGNVYISGDLSTQGAKSAVLRHSDGLLRRVYALESPESWFEDLGRAEVVDGQAEVELDSEFAAMVQTDDYHVFLTPEGETQGLYVNARTPDRFEVREQQGGTSSLTFSYRVVAKRSDIEAERLQQIAAPAALADTFSAESPEPPELRY